MRIAYLFAENAINYDIDFQVLSAMKPDELKSLDTLVRTGVWGLFDEIEDREDAVAQRLTKLFYGGEGNISWTDNERLVEAIQPGLVYTVQFQSLGRSLAQGLHQKLKKRSGNYLGYVQVLADTWPHHLVFRGCEPRYELEHGNVYVLYSSIREDKSLAKEHIKGWKKKYSDLKYIPLTGALKKRDINLRFSTIDANDGASSDAAAQRAIRILGDMWEIQAEHTLYRLQDTAPLAIDELFAALKTLEEADEFTSHAAGVAVHLRRVIEEITRQYFSKNIEDSVADGASGDDGPKDDSSNDEGPGWVQNLWSGYLAEINKGNLDKKEKMKSPHQRTRTYESVIAHEGLDLANVIYRLKSVYEMEHKAIHEDWDVELFRSISLRLVLLLNDLMRLKQGKKHVKIDRYFRQVLLEEEE